MIRIHFTVTKPWEDAEQCVLGLFSLREMDQWIEVGIGFIFLAISICFYSKDKER
jgi:hypothetical protein